MSPEHRQLADFYDVDSLEALVDAQERHISKLQEAKRQEAKSRSIAFEKIAFSKVREG